MTKCVFNNKKNALTNFLTQNTIFCPHHDKFVAGKLIMKQALRAFASALLPPWPVRMFYCGCMFRKCIEKLDQSFLKSVLIVNGKCTETIFVKSSWNDIHKTQDC